MYTIVMCISVFAGIGKNIFKFYKLMENAFKNITPEFTLRAVKSINAVTHSKTIAGASIETTLPTWSYYMYWHKLYKNTSVC